MKWNDFAYSGTVYDLTHLHPFEHHYEHTPTGGEVQVFKCHVIFSMHCFTRDLEDGDNYTADLIYPYDKDHRLFDFARYELSKQLPDIIRSLNQRPCWHTHHGTFFTIEITDQDNQKKDYEVYFSVTRASRGKGWLNLYVHSAYMRDEAHRGSQPRKRKIGFNVIAHNTQTGKRIKPPR